jgi:prevent-host-death family protein
MQKVGSREFKNHLGRYLLAVRRGKTLLVTDRGKPVAKVSPPDEEDARSDLSFEEVLKRLDAQGNIRLAKRPLSKFRAIPSGGKSASQMHRGSQVVLISIRRHLLTISSRIGNGSPQTQTATGS